MVKRKEDNIQKSDSTKLLNKLKNSPEESEEKFRAIFEYNSAAIAIIESDTTISMVNDAYCEMSGYSREDVIGTSWTKQIPPDDLERLKEYNRQRLANQNDAPEKYEFTFYKKNGEIRHALMTVSLIQSCKQIITSFIDITERKIAEETQRESETHFRTLANSGQALIWTSGIDKKCNYFNQPWLEFTGRSLEQELDDGWVEGVHPDDLQQCVDTYITAFDLHERFSMEYRVLHVSGEYRWIQDDGSPRFNSKGEFVGFIGHCLDITERKQTEMAILESGQLFSEMFDKSPVALLVTTPFEGLIVDVNQAFLNDLEYCRDDVIGKTTLEINIFDNLNDRNKLINILKENRTVYGFECGFRTKTGKLVFGLLSIVYVQIKSKNYQLTTIIDITARKQADEVVKLEEARLECLLKINQHSVESIQELLDFALEEAISITESKIGYIYFYNDNKKEFTLNTWSKEVMHQCTVVEPRTVYNLEKTGIWGEAVRQRQPILINDFTASNPLKKGIPDGHAPLHKFLSIPVLNGSEIIAVVGVANKQNDYNDTDIRQLNLMMDAVWKIVQRKQTEEALKESEERFRALFTQMSEGVALHEVIYNADHKAIDYKIIDINPAFEKQVGIHAEKAKGELATQLYSVSPAPYLDIYSHVAETGEHQSFQSYFQPLNQYFEISVFSPTRGYFATIFTDITERMRAEKALIESEANLRESNATKDKFFSIIAHDLKGPFNSIIGFSNILTEQVHEKDYDGIEEYARIIQNSSQRAMDLLLNLLEWSRSQTGRIVFNPEFVEIVTLINQVTELMNDSAQQKSIIISKKLPRNAPVIADKAMINTILRNTISNAIKFTHPGGQIIISVEQQKNELMIAIADNGLGIKKEAIDKLFRIEESNSTYGTQNERGTGLGLILCKEFVEKNGGKIWVESEVGKGSTFYFTIPKQ